MAITVSKKIIFAYVGATAASLATASFCAGVVLFMYTELDKQIQDNLLNSRIIKKQQEFIKLRQRDHIRLIQGLDRLENPSKCITTPRIITPVYTNRKYYINAFGDCVSHERRKPDIKLFPSHSRFTLG